MPDIAAAPSDRAAEPRWLVAPAAAVYDAGAVAADLRAAASIEAGDAAKRLEACRILRQALEAGRARIRAAFDQNHRIGYDVARSLAWLTDRVVIDAFHFVANDLMHRASPTTGERVAVVAVGGYGRGELAPFSDVDLLFLTPYKKTAWGESVIEATLYLLWDLKLKVGHATRSVEECLRRARSDYTIRTALLEQRFLCGAPELQEELERRLFDELISRTGPEFVEAKLDERDARHKKTGGSRYLLEPNVKESKGGLRDVHTLFWLAKYLYRSCSASELVEKGVFAKDEAMRCRWASKHLWTVRIALHYVAGRAEEKLTFDRQIDLAERFGYREAEGQRAVERFMKRYFLAAKTVGDLTGIFCAALEEQHKKTPPMLGGMLRFLSGAAPAARRGPPPEGVLLREGRLTVEDPELFRREPVAIFRLFREAIRREVAVHPAALRAVGRHRRAVDERMRADPEAQRLFMELLADSEDPPRALRLMNLTGVLGRFIPDFGRIIAQMQFNMYHHYTVDEHSILAVETLYRLIRGELKDEHPIETEIAVGLRDRRVIAVALLLHDVGKGLPEDHSIVGARIARVVCPALGMSLAETEQVAWLVRWHLAMSDVAQKRDLSELATIRGFAELVRSPARLKLLYVLTACDIRAVGPGVWNGWKGQLLRQLYHETRATLTGQAEGVSRGDRLAAAQAALRVATSEWDEAAWAAHVARFEPHYWTALGTSSHHLHARLIAEAGSSCRAAHPEEAEIRMATETSAARAATEVAFYTQDHPGLFARMAGALALVGADVVDARAFTTRDGMAINTFWVQDAEYGPFSDPDRLRASVERVLKGEVLARDALKARRKLRKREQPFEVEPQIVFDNDAADRLTVIEVNGRDRVGLLHDLARALAAESVNIVSAIIATYGEHVVDVFYVKDVFGMKITQPGKQERVERALVTAIEKSGPS